MEKRTIVSTGWLAGHLRDPDVIVIDCRFSLTDTEAGRRAYTQGHVPGACYLHLDEDLSGTKTGSNGRHPLPKVADFSSVLRKLGVMPEKIVVAYDDAGGMFAARLWWMMRWAGLYNCAVLDGAWSKWTAEQRPITADVPTTQASKFEGVTDNNLLVKADDVSRDLGKRHNMQLIDARSAERFRGENETLDPVGGHIPGALNRFYQGNLDATGCFKPANTLRQEFAALLGEREPLTVVHQCGSGVTACHNLLAMEIAGLHGAKLYAGSWSEWCADAGRPIER